MISRVPLAFASSSSSSVAVTASRVDQLSRRRSSWLLLLELYWLGALQPAASEGSATIPAHVRAICAEV